MAPHRNEHLQGTLALLVLRTLAQRGPLHGYGIVSHIDAASGELLRVEEGSLYPALHRMTQAGWLKAEWRLSENNRRARFYSLTPRGRDRLAEEEERWSRVVKGLSRMLRFA
jgi:PadR family transcriptional regulator, regulatory protein PadR